VDHLVFLALAAVNLLLVWKVNLDRRQYPNLRKPGLLFMAFFGVMTGFCLRLAWDPPHPDWRVLEPGEPGQVLKRSPIEKENEYRVTQGAGKEPIWVEKEPTYHVGTNGSLSWETNLYHPTFGEQAKPCPTVADVVATAPNGNYWSGKPPFKEEEVTRLALQTLANYLRCQSEKK
jgi:hypothetical protein